MESFVVSARKYRPQHFNTVVGQGHITATLKNAIKQKQLAQAYLFCGPRGVGKTTCARIFAKTINCFQITEQGEACDTCESCQSFNAGASLNIYELDAASNNSVDDIRNLVDQVRFAPQLGQYKVYIIDEVHMLSSQAFNAFLKTLEEPPAHAKFILATTEKHKIIPTILSRCQIFNFNRIKTEDISNHLEYLAKNEQVSFEPEALHIIAQKADGGLRDACSIFDQMVAFTAGNLTYKQVVENLHVLDYDYYFQLTDAFLSQQIPQIMLLFDEIQRKGFDAHNFVVGLGEHLRNILVSKDPQTTSLLEVSQSLRQRYAEQAAKCSVQFLMNALASVSKTDVNYKAAKNPRLLVEMMLLNLARLNAGIESEKKKPDLNTESVTNNSSVTSVEKTNSDSTVKTAVKPLLGLKEIKTAAFSLKATLSELPQPGQAEVLQENTDTIEYTDTLPNSEEVRKVMLAFVQRNASEAKSLHVSIESCGIQVLPTHQILVTLLNHSLLEKFRDIKQEMLSVLKKELKNKLLSIDFEVKEEENNSAKLYKPIDKYKHLISLNPALQELKKRLDLEIDY